MERNDKSETKITESDTAGLITDGSKNAGATEPKRHITVKSITGIVALLALFAIIVGLIGYFSFTEAILEQYANGAFLTAETAAEHVDADRIGEYLESGGETEGYKSVWDKLDHLCNSTGSTFIYVIIPDRSDYAHITFLFSTIDHDSKYTIYDFGYLRETTNDEYRTKYRALYENEADRELVIRDKGYIETDKHITAIIPLRGSDGLVKALLCVQRQMDVLAKVRNGYIIKIALALTLLIALVVISQTVYLNHVLLKPLNQISGEATRFSVENVKSSKKLREIIKNDDEIGQLAESIDRMEEQIESYVENLTKITAEKERIGTELSLATRIQAAMMPHIFPPFPDRREIDIYGAMDPAKEIGGDFYDFFFTDDTHLCLVIADVSGKGIPAALFMMVSKIVISSCAMLGRSAAEVLTKTNEAICSNNSENMFVSVWIGILDTTTGELAAANAGHEYPALKEPDGGFELLNDKHGLVIGAMEGIKYREYTLRLKPGSKLFVYTDGVPEATDSSEKMFGTDRMLEALNEDSGASPEQLLKNVRRAVDGFTGDAEQFDDLTMLCIEYKGKNSQKSLETHYKQKDNYGNPVADACAFDRNVDSRLR